jgi:hypothetical protein
LTGAPPNKGRLVALLLVPAAGVVAGLLLVLRLQLEPPTVPIFALSGDGGIVALHRGERFDLTLAPTVPVAGAIAARAFLVRDGNVQPWDPPFTTARDGTVTLTGTVDALFEGVAAGPWDIAIAVGRPETLPTAPRDILLAADAGAEGRAWRLVHRRVVLGG